MGIYSYTAKSSSGERVQGTIDANDRRAAMVQIERMGHVPISVKEGAGPAPKKKLRKGVKEKSDTASRFKLERRASTKAPKMKLRELLLFSQELSDLLASGMTLGTALNTLSNRKNNPGTGDIITGLRDEIIKGTSLSEALAQYPQTFQSLYVNLVKAGEASGTLPETLENLCHHYTRVQEAREKVVSALIYPIIVLCAGFFTMLFVMFFAVPRFSQMFEEMGSTLPLPTRMLVGCSEFLLKYGWLVGLLSVGAFFLFKRYINTPAGKYWWHGFLLKMPVAKGIIASNAFAHFSRTLGALLKNGVPVLKALDIVEHTAGNAVIAQEIVEAKARVTDGSSISGPLAAGNVFPPLFTDMMAVGEETGDMPGALSHITRRYDGELDRNIQVLTTLLEPLLMLLVAVMVGFVAISMLMAVFNLTSGLGQ